MFLFLAMITGLRTKLQSLGKKLATAKGKYIRNETNINRTCSVFGSLLKKYRSENTLAAKNDIIVIRMSWVRYQYPM